MIAFLFSYTFHYLVFSHFELYFSQYTFKIRQQIPQLKIDDNLSHFNRSECELDLKSAQRSCRDRQCDIDFGPRRDLAARTVLGLAKLVIYK